MSLVLAAGEGVLKQVGETVVLLAGRQIVELLPKVKQRTGDNTEEFSHTHLL